MNSSSLHKSMVFCKYSEMTINRLLLIYICFTKRFCSANLTFSVNLEVQDQSLFFSWDLKCLWFAEGLYCPSFHSFTLLEISHLHFCKKSIALWSAFLHNIDHYHNTLSTCKYEVISFTSVTKCFLFVVISHYCLSKPGQSQCNKLSQTESTLHWHLYTLSSINKSCSIPVFHQRWNKFPLQIEHEKKKKDLGKRAREDEDVVKALLFNAFERHQYYNLKDLISITKQPVVRIVCCVWS